MPGRKGVKLAADKAPRSGAASGSVDVCANSDGYDYLAV
jgi:hypothetical protein